MEGAREVAGRWGGIQGPRGRPRFSSGKGVNGVLWLVESIMKLSCFAAEALETFRILRESRKAACHRPCAWETSSMFSHRRKQEKFEGSVTGHDRLFLQL